MPSPSPSEADAPSHSRRWTSRSAASRFKHGVFYLLIRLGGRRAAYALLAPVTLFYALLPSVAARCAPYLGRRFPGRGPFRRFLDRFRLCFGLGLVLVDRAALGIRGPEAEVAFPQRDELLSLAESGQGLIVLLAHVGGWQLVMSGLKLVRTDVSVVMYRGEEDVDRHYFEHGRGAPPFRIIDPRAFLGGVLEIMDELRRGNVVCVMGDRVWGNEEKTLAVEFMGGAARLPYAAFKLAASSGAPIAVVFSHRDSDRRYVVELAQVLRLPPTRKPEAFRQPLQSFARSLEAYASKRPYQFFNFYDMW